MSLVSMRIRGISIGADFCFVCCAGAGVLREDSDCEPASQRYGVDGMAGRCRGA